MSIEMADAGLWHAFDAATNEMVITKRGRRMYPVVQVSVAHLHGEALYRVFLDFKQQGNRKCRYTNGQWHEGGEAEAQPVETLYEHPNSPNYGHFWMKQVVDFGQIKLSNKSSRAATRGKSRSVVHSDPSSVKQQSIVLNSLHKYRLALRIVDVVAASSAVAVGVGSSVVINAELPYTNFIAVTAYQNERLTALKIEHNPFAKAFLEDGRGRNKCKGRGKSSTVRKTTTQHHKRRRVDSDASSKVTPPEAVVAHDQKPPSPDSTQSPCPHYETATAVPVLQFDVSAAFSQVAYPSLQQQQQQQQQVMSPTNKRPRTAASIGSPPDDDNMSIYIPFTDDINDYGGHLNDDNAISPSWQHGVASMPVTQSPSMATLHQHYPSSTWSSSYEMPRSVQYQHQHQQPQYQLQQPPNPMTQCWLPTQQQLQAQQQQYNAQPAASFLYTRPVTSDVDDKNNDAEKPMTSEYATTYGGHAFL